MDRKSTVKEIEHIIISIVNCIFFSTFFVTFVFYSHVHSYLFTTKELFTTFLVFESHFFDSMFQRNWFIICIKTKQSSKVKGSSRGIWDPCGFIIETLIWFVSHYNFLSFMCRANIWRSWQNSNIKQENIALLSSGFGHSTLVTNQHNNLKYAENDTQVEDYITSSQGS